MLTNRRRSRELSFSDMWSALEGFYSIAELCYNWIFDASVNSESTPAPAKQKPTSGQHQPEHGSLSTLRVQHELRRRSAEQTSIMVSTPNRPRPSGVLTPKEVKIYQQMKKQRKELLTVKKMSTVKLNDKQHGLLLRVVEKPKVRFAEEVQIIPASPSKKI